MDFPLNLTSSPYWVYGREELAQVVVSTLSNHTGEFAQSCTYGARFSVHESDATSLDEGIRSTISQIPQVRFVSSSINATNIVVNVEYDGETIEIDFARPQ